MPLKKTLRDEIQAYFEIRWPNDKVSAFCCLHDRAIIEQMPNKIQHRIYYDFLFDDFLSQFKQLFTFTQSTPEIFKSVRRTKKDSKFIQVTSIKNHKTTFFRQISTQINSKLLYTWENEGYAQFMLDILQNLEPRLIPPNTLISGEKEAVLEHLFVEKGSICVGYV